MCYIFLTSFSYFSSSYLKLLSKITFFLFFFLDRAERGLGLDVVSEIFWIYF